MSKHISNSSFSLPIFLNLPSSRLKPLFAKTSLLTKDLHIKKKGSILRNKACSISILFLLFTVMGACFLQYGEASETKYESYTLEGFIDYETVDTHFVALVLWFNKLNSPGLFNVSIRNTNVHGIPTNQNLADCNNTNGNYFSEVYGNPTRIVFPLTPKITLNASTLYAIVVSHPSNGDESHRLRWATGWDTYKDGSLLLGPPDGQDWDDEQELDDLDAYFEIWDTDLSEGNVTIKPDGSIKPSTAPIFTLDNTTYLFSGNMDASFTIEKI